jgi:hypothetical protein
MILLTLTAVIPVGTGALGIVGGLLLGPGPDATSAYFDSEYRFLNGIWLCVGIVLLWSLRQPEARATITRTLLAVCIVGGVARLVSVAAQGWPPGVFGASLIVELTVIPALLIWHRSRITAV